MWGFHFGYGCRHGLFVFGSLLGFSHGGSKTDSYTFLFEHRSKKVGSRGFHFIKREHVRNLLGIP